VKTARIVLALIAVVLGLAGCAAIPTETLPQPANIDLGQDSQAAVAQPQSGLSAPDIVRGFLDNTADSTSDYAAAAAYLASSSRAGWNPKASTQIISTDFDTITTPTKNPDQQVVTVRASVVGALNPDGSFTAGSGVFQTNYLVAKQRDTGQWRIVRPADGLVIPYNFFQVNYHQVPIYFYDPTYSELVPDLRWVATEPTRGLPARIIDLLLEGPSAAVHGAVNSAIPAGVTPKTTVEETDDGAILVNLDNVPQETDHTKLLMVAQIVASLRTETDGVVRIESDANPLVSGRRDWRYSELPVYPVAGPSANLPGLTVAHGRVYSLKDGAAVSGQAGNGSFSVQTAAQSGDGNELAAVVSIPGTGAALRIGSFGGTLNYVDLNAQQMTRPTWAPGDVTGGPSREVWTVADQQVVRVDDNTTAGMWQATPVDSTALAGDGAITDLRLSRDGTRVAVVAGGHVFVGAVVISQQGAVSIKQVTELQADTLNDVTGVDWLDGTDLVVSTGQPRLPVVKLTMDGLVMDPYLTTNLTAPVTAVTGAPSRPVIVADANGLWETSDTTEIWQSIQHTDNTGAVPLYPG
jgi:hypothetical protein